MDVTPGQTSVACCSEFRSHLTIHTCFSQRRAEAQRYLLSFYSLFASFSYLSTKHSFVGRPRHFFFLSQSPSRLSIPFDTVGFSRKMVNETKVFSRQNDEDGYLKIACERKRSGFTAFPPFFFLFFCFERSGP